MPPPPPSESPEEIDLRRNVLVVEDDEATGDILEYILESAACEVTTCRSLSEARRLLSEGSYALYMVDLHLPDGRGFELIDEIKRSDRDGEVVVLSGLKQQQSYDKCMALGAIDYITKPFSPSDLVARVGTWIPN